MTTLYNDYTTRLLAHELGHVIGLIHDDMRNSIMAPNNILATTTMSEKNKTCYYAVAACTTTPTLDWENKDIICSPNPVVNELTITSNNFSEIDKIKIYDILGKTVFEKKNYGINSIIDFSGFPSGLYYLNIKMGHKDFIKKIIKK